MIKCNLLIDWGWFLPDAGNEYWKLEIWDLDTGFQDTGFWMEKKKEIDGNWLRFGI